MKQHTVQLIVILSLSINLVLTKNINQVSSDLSVDKRDAILQDCNTTIAGSRCIIGCPGQNKIDGNCPVGRCCREPDNNITCTKDQGTCIDPDKCKDPGYALPWRCPKNNEICCITVGAIACGNGGRCVVDCPDHNRVMPGHCPDKTGKCCKSPTDDVACNKEFGNCVQRAQCKTPKYYLPWRCSGDEDRVCCHDPRFVLIIKWLDCLWRKIEATFYCLSNVRVTVSCILYYYSNETEISRESIELLPGQPFITKNFTVPSCYEDYLLVWTVHSDPEHTGYVVLYRCANGWGKKDPHMVTFSGHKYSYQGYCSYTLVKDCRSYSPAFDITADFRGKYNPMEPPTRMVAVSTTVNGYDTYTFRDDHSVLHNGKLVLERELTIAGGMGHITVEDDSVALSLGKDGVSLEWISKEHEASVTIGNDDLAGKLCGMLGDGSSFNDLVKSDGTRTTNVTEFAKSWEIPGSCP